MAIAIEPGRIVDYVLKNDRKLPKEQQTVFKIKVLTARELAQIEDSYSTIDMDGQFHFKTGTRTLAILDVAVTGWENLKDKKEQPIPYDKGNANRWDYLRQDYRTELANFITEQTRLNEGELKN